MGCAAAASVGQDRGGRRVATYYLYRLHPNGRITARDVLEAEDDAEAVALAERAEHGDAMELWQGARMVRAFEGGRGIPR